VRLNIPALSGDVRKKMVARTKELAEETKVAIRNVRRDANKHLEQLEKDKSLSEDDLKSYKDDVQELTTKCEGQVEDLAKSKTAEVMEQ
jgi:ribosome recycling factor